jgi:hypothetical protein
MKGLICFWGKIRDNIEIVKNNYYKLFPEHNLKFLISTWDSEVFDKRLFNFVIQNNDPTEEYLNQINFPYTQQLKNNPNLNYGRIGHYSQFFHNLKIYNFIENLNHDYDFIIKCRTDLIFETKYIFDFTKNICFVPKIYHASKGFGINDHFMAGNFNYLKNSMKMKDLYSVYEIFENSWNPEIVLEKLIKYNNCIIEEFDCSSYKLLPDRTFL